MIEHWYKIKNIWKTWKQVDKIKIMQIKIELMSKNTYNNIINKNINKNINMKMINITNNREINMFILKITD